MWREVIFHKRFCVVENPIFNGKISTCPSPHRFKTLQLVLKTIRINLRFPHMPVITNGVTQYSKLLLSYFSLIEIRFLKTCVSLQSLLILTIPKCPCYGENLILQLVNIFWIKIVFLQDIAFPMYLLNCMSVMSVIAFGISFHVFSSLCCFLNQNSLASS